MTVQCRQGDCRELMAAMPEQSVHCCVTSPPYWGLRSYGTAPLSWPEIRYSPLPGLSPCVEVPAMEASLGLEPTLEAFIGHMVLVFREVRRVMRDDGTLWLNCGDSYAGSRCGPDGSKDSRNSRREASMTASRRRDNEPIPRSDFAIPGLKAKDLVGQPWRLAFALQADGWWRRQDCIYAKKNPMPESTKDRCTKAHEYVFLLAKSARYYFDQKAIAEVSSENTHARRAIKVPDGFATGGDDRKKGKYGPLTGQDSDGPHRTKSNLNVRKLAGAKSGTKNKRSVWHLASEPLREAHFAAFPTALVEPCILAGCPLGGVVLDPFGGAGTTGLVADRLLRSAVLCELNPDYIEIARRRISGDASLLSEVS